VQNPLLAQPAQLRKAVHAQPPVFLKGRIASSPGGPLRNPGGGPPFYALRQPARARQPLPPAGRTYTGTHAPAGLAPVVVLQPWVLAITAANPVLVAIAAPSSGNPAPANPGQGFSSVPGIAVPGRFTPGALTPPVPLAVYPAGIVRVTPAVPVAVTITQA